MLSDPVRLREELAIVQEVKVVFELRGWFLVGLSEVLLPLFLRWVVELHGLSFGASLDE